MPPKKSSKRVSSSDVRSYANRIEKFLKKAKRSYSEPSLVEAVFGIRTKKNAGVPSSEKQLKTLSVIKDALKLLVQEKKVVTVLLEDADTKEEELQYSTSGWNVTP